MSVSQYLKNCCDMLRDWSKDRVSEKPFFKEPKVTDNSWTMAWNFLYKDEPIIQKAKHGSQDIHVLCKKINKSLININIVKSIFSKVKLGLDKFIECVKSVKMIKLDRDNWAKSKCSCSWFQKNYFCYHIIALAVNEKLVEIPLEYKLVVIESKPKRGRKPKAKVGLVRQ